MASWLDLVSESTGWSLLDTGRLDDTIQNLNHPRTQYPSVLYFAGNDNRIKALQALFPGNNITRRGPTGLARLHLSTATASTTNPVIFAESTLFNQSGFGESGRPRWSSDRHRHYEISRDKSRTLSELQFQVITQFLFPWIHVLCLFVDSAFEIEEVLKLLNAPRGKVMVGGRPVGSSMRVIMVLTSRSTKGAAQVNRSLYAMQSSSEYQSSITVLDIRDRDELSPKAAFEPLERLVLDQIQGSQRERVGEGTLFSACHLNVLWSRMLQLPREGLLSTGLECLQVARENYQKGASMATCIRELLNDQAPAERTADNTHEFIASALLMDAYPPGMHCKSQLSALSDICLPVYYLSFANSD